MENHHSHHERSVYQLASLAQHLATNGHHGAALELMKHSVHLAAIEEETDG